MYSTRTRHQLQYSYSPSNNLQYSYSYSPSKFSRYSYSYSYSPSKFPRYSYSPLSFHATKYSYSRSGTRTQPWYRRIKKAELITIYCSGPTFIHVFYGKEAFKKGKSSVSQKPPQRTLCSLRGVP